MTDINIDVEKVIEALKGFKPEKSQRIYLKIDVELLKQLQNDPKLRAIYEAQRKAHGKCGG